jgi:hypothetical protein
LCSGVWLSLLRSCWIGLLCGFRARMDRQRKIAKIMRSDGHSRTSISGNPWAGASLGMCILLGKNRCDGSAFWPHGFPWLHPNCGSFLTVHTEFRTMRIAFSSMCRTFSFYCSFKNKSKNYGPLLHARVPSNLAPNRAHQNCGSLLTVHP